MNKLSMYAIKAVIKPLGKVLVYPAIPFRAYARSVVYNYVLQYGLPLKRLRERGPPGASTSAAGY